MINWRESGLRFAHLAKKIIMFSDGIGAYERTYIDFDVIQHLEYIHLVIKTMLLLIITSIKCSYELFMKRMCDKISSHGTGI